MHIKSRDMSQGISLLLGFQAPRSVRLAFQAAECTICRQPEAKAGGV